jgi:S1-C subfamily serine protease
LARIDRETPRYGIGEYNDFNTFYYQAASSTSSGSSGSPVLDLKGRAIALNAGGACSSSSSYYLPLDRVKRALQLIQQNQPIPRGTLQTTFEYLSYDALSQLGLGKQLERGLRSTQSNGEGLLVVKDILPDGPAYGLLEPGDILLSCNGQLLKGLFTDLEEHLDDAIEKNQSVRFVVSRGKEIKEFELNVQDLHEITPHRYLEFGGAILNDLSYQTARSYGLSLKDCGIFVGAAGYILGTAHAVRKSVIVAFNNKPIRNLDDFIKVVSEIEQGARVPVKYYSLSRPLKTKVMIAHVDWRWHLFRLAVRNGI